MTRLSLVSLTRAVAQSMSETAAWVASHVNSTTKLAVLVLTAALPELLLAQQVNIGTQLNGTMNGLAGPIVAFAVLARFAVMGLALWGVGKNIVDAVGGDGGAFFKGIMALFILIMVYNPLWILNNVLGLAISPISTDFCGIGTITLCPAQSFGGQ